MTVIDVKVKTVDRSARFLPPSRTVEIKTKKGNIVTPTRASTSYEFKRKAQVPTDIPIETEISFNLQRLNYKNIKSLLTTNAFLEKLSRRIDLNNRLEQYSKIRIFLLQPTASRIPNPETGGYYPSGMEFLQENPGRLTDFLSIIIGAQYRMGLDLITIPFLDLPLNDLKEVVLQANAAIERLNCAPFFVIDMKYQAFATILDFIVDNTRAQFVGLVFRDYLKAVQSYRALSKLADRDIAFFAIQVSRVDMARENISVMHYLPFLANDIYSVEVPNQFVPQPSQSKQQFNLSNIRFFDRSTLQVNSLSAESLDDRIKAYKNDKIIANMLENYADSVTDAKKYGMINAFSKIDELKSSLSEFSNLQKFIGEDSSKDYLQDKSTLDRVLRPMSSSNKFEKWFG